MEKTVAEWEAETKCYVKDLNKYPLDLVMTEAEWNAIKEVNGKNTAMVNLPVRLRFLVENNYELTRENLFHEAGIHAKPPEEINGINIVEAVEKVSVAKIVEFENMPLDGKRCLEIEGALIPECVIQETSDNANMQISKISENIVQAEIVKQSEESKTDEVDEYIESANKLKSQYQQQADNAQTLLNKLEE